MRAPNAIFVYDCVRVYTPLLYCLVAQQKFGFSIGHRAFLESTRKIVTVCGEICNSPTSRLGKRGGLLLEIYASLMTAIMYFGEKNVGIAYKCERIHLSWEFPLYAFSIFPNCSPLLPRCDTNHTRRPCGW